MTNREENVCRRCSGFNPDWAAESPLWNEVMRGGDIDGSWQFNEIICPSCFMQIATTNGIALQFQVTAPNPLVPLKMETASGRVWNPETFLWEEPTVTDERSKSEPRREAMQRRVKFEPNQAMVEAAMKDYRRPGGAVVPKTEDLIRRCFQVAIAYLADPANAQDAKAWAEATMEEHGYYVPIKIIPEDVPGTHTWSKERKPLYRVREAQ